MSLALFFRCASIMPFMNRRRSLLKNVGFGCTSGRGSIRMRREDGRHSRPYKKSNEKKLDGLSDHPPDGRLRRPALRGKSIDDLRHILDMSLALFFRCASVMPFMNRRRSLLKNAGFAAQIVAVQHDDCGKTVGIADPTRNRMKRTWTV